MHTIPCLIILCLLLPTAEANAQDTTALNIRYQQELKNVTMGHELLMLDSIVKAGAAPEFIDALKAKGQLSFLTYKSGTRVSANQYRYDSLRINLVGEAGSVYNDLEQRRKIDVLAGMKEHYKLVALFRGWTSTLDDSHISELQDADYYLMAINKMLNTKKEQLMAQGWTRDNYIAWENGRHPANSYQRAVVRKSFLKYIKMTYGIEP